MLARIYERIIFAARHKATCRAAMQAGMACFRAMMARGDFDDIFMMLIISRLSHCRQQALISRADGEPHMPADSSFSARFSPQEATDSLASIR